LTSFGVGILLDSIGDPLFCLSGNRTTRKPRRSGAVNLRSEGDLVVELRLGFGRFRRRRH
jgi:hypothetical protein